MAEEDIYGNKRKYEALINNFYKLKTKTKKNSFRKYYVKNPQNLKYFKKLCKHFEKEDQSYIRRNKVLTALKRVTYFTNKDLSKCSRDDIDDFVIKARKIDKQPKYFIKDLKFTWKVLFPEKDSKGRIIDDVSPYPVRHLKTKQDISRQETRKDKLTWDEYDSIIKYLSPNNKYQNTILNN